MACKSLPSKKIRNGSEASPSILDWLNFEKTKRTNKNLGTGHDCILSMYPLLFATLPI